MMEERIAQLEKELRELKEVYYKDNLISTQRFSKNVEFTNKVGFFGKPATTKGASVATVATPGAIYSQSEAIATATAVNALISRLQGYGLLP